MRMQMKAAVGVFIVGFSVFSISARAQLPNCTIDFDGTCPTVSEVCGATFADGLGCVTAALAFCYSSGLFGYGVDNVAPPLTITLSEGMNDLRVFFSGAGGATGEMRFFDAEVDGNEVGSPLTTNGDCLLAMPALQVLAFDTPVRRVEVTATDGNVWIDDFNINPSNIPALSTRGVIVMTLLVLSAGAILGRGRLRWKAAPPSGVSSVR